MVELALLFDLDSSLRTSQCKRKPLVIQGLEEIIECLYLDPVNLGLEVNSRFSETAPGLLPDNRRLYFASSRIDEPLVRSSPANYRQLERELHAIQNGLLNIYLVPKLS